MKRQTYQITVIGCQMNKADGERIAGYLEKNGFSPVAEGRKADIFVLATCGVRQSAEDRIYGLLPRFRQLNPKSLIVLTGCLSERDDVKRRLAGKVDIWLPIVRLPELVNLIKGKRVEKKKRDEYLEIKPRYTSHFSAFVPVGNGCNNFCSYCVVPYARGRETYRPAAKILVEIGKLVKAGYKEIILIAQNVNSYRSGSKGGKMDFADLLAAAAKIKGDFWIRFATCHPKDISEKLIKTIAGNEKICRHVHLPIQAGSDRILKAMNRKHTAGYYLGLIKKIRKAMPDAAVSTDVIVGFPGETAKDFAATKKIFRSVGFDQAFIARYSPRPGTAAVKIKDNVSAETKKNRENELAAILSKIALARNRLEVGRTEKVLVENEFGGRTAANKPVRIISARKIPAGNFVQVRITKARDFGFEGTCR